MSTEQLSNNTNVSESRDQDINEIKRKNVKEFNGKLSHQTMDDKEESDDQMTTDNLPHHNDDDDDDDDDNNDGTNGYPYSNGGGVKSDNDEQYSNNHSKIPPQPLIEDLIEYKFTERDNEAEAITDYSADYFHLYQRSVVKYDALLQQFQNFKTLMVSHLTDIKTESVQRDQMLTQYVNAMSDEKHKLQKENNKKVKQKENEIQQLKSKYTESRNEAKQAKKSVDQIRKDVELEKEKLVRKCDDLEKEKRSLIDKLQTQKTLVEEEKKAKLAVKEENSVHLRNERKKIAKELDKERKTCQIYEKQIVDLQDALAKCESLHKDCRKEIDVTQKRESKAQQRAEKAVEEREEAMRKLKSKSQLCKAQNETLENIKRDYERIQTQLENQKTANSALHQAIRRKSEKEKEFDDIRKRLDIRERELDEKEKQFERKVKTKTKPKPKKIVTAKRTSNSFVNAAAKISGNEQWQGLLEKDPFYDYRNVLPWHYLFVFTFIILMIAIAQRNG